MPRSIDRDGSGWGKLFGRLTEKLADVVPPAPRRKREKRLRMERDSRRGMSGRGYLARYATAGPMTIEELLARLDEEGRSAVLALDEARQAELLRVYEAFDRHLQAPGSHKAAVLEKLVRMLLNGRLLHDRRPNGGLLPRLARRIGARPAGRLRGRVDGLMLLSYVVTVLAEPQPGPAAGRSAAEMGVAALANSLALAWPARWAEIALALAFDGTWQGIEPVLRPGGSPPDGLIQGSLLAFARTLPPDGKLAPGFSGVLDGLGGTGSRAPGQPGSLGAGQIADRREARRKEGAIPDRPHPLPGDPGVPGRAAERDGASEIPDHGQFDRLPDRAERLQAGRDDLTVGQLDLLGRILETDRGAELDVEGRDPAWALAWLARQLEAGVPARAGIVHDGKGMTVQVLRLTDRGVLCAGGLALAPAAFLASLRRVIVDGEYLSRVGL